MTQPEQFRDQVHGSEGIRPGAERTGSSRSGLDRPEGLHGDFGARLDGEAAPQDRESQFREIGRNLGREPFREASGRDSFGRDPGAREPMGRILGSPLPGSPLPGSTPVSGLPGTGGTDAPAPRGIPPGRALQGPGMAGEDPTAMQRAMGILKQAAPFVARLLPLIDANFGAAIGGLLTGRPHGGQQVTVDLAPVKNQLADLQAQQTDLRSSMQEQTAGLKRVEDQLDLVREATDRNTLEQQELMEDLKTVAHKVNMVALGLSVLLLASLVINVILYMYVKRVLP